MTGFDWKNPDYDPVFTQRSAALTRWHQHPEISAGLKIHYKDHILQFINDWGVTVDPRNASRGVPTTMPFLLFPSQEEFVLWIVDHWLSRKHGLVEKSRDMGATWLSVAIAVWIWSFFPGSVVGFGSRKEEYVDRAGDPKSIFWKLRQFINFLPAELRPCGYDERKHAAHMRIINPENGSAIIGEAGDNIGRGDRTSIYFVDEVAHIERAQLLEFSLSQTTNCRIDLSSANGMANAFAEKRHSGRVDVLSLHWRSDPRKGQAWYEEQVDRLPAVVVAQEIDIDYSASVEGILILSAWVQSAINAHLKLGFNAEGVRRTALDVADEGRDKNALCSAKGVVVDFLKEWTGKDSDIFGTVAKTFMSCDELGASSFFYDADGLGAGVKGDARVLNESRGRKISADPFRGSGAVVDPDKEMVPGRLNKDFFANAKAQAWWALRTRFELTHRAVTEGLKVSPDQLISLSGTLTELGALQSELSRPTYSLNGAGKILIDKAPDGTPSPNKADSLMILFAPHAVKRQSYWG